MNILTSHITIGKYTFDYVHELSIETGIENMTASGMVMLPKNLKFIKGQMKSEILRGDAVSIKLGYNGNLNTVFSGFVSSLNTGVPVEIKVQDLMWKLKQIQVNDVAKDETLKSFLQRNLPFEIDCFDIALPKYVCHRKTGAQLLDMIREDFGFYVFVRNGKIVIGKQYDPQNYKRHRIKLDYNNVEEDLEYMIRDEINIKVTAISNLESGKKIEFEYGSSDGEEKTLNFYNLQKKELEEIAQKEYEKLRYDGYRGSVTIFGEPFVQAGDVIEIINDDDSDKNGSYWVDGVNYTFGVANGFRQECQLGART